MPDQIAGDSGGVVTDPVGSSPTAGASPDASSADTIVSSESQSPQTPGPVPYERFHEVNSKYGNVSWAEGLDRDRVHQQASFFQWLDADPQGAFNYLQDYLGRAGRLPKPSAQQDDARPQPDIVVPETGHKFYSAEAAERLSQWVARQSVQPLEQRLQTIEAQSARGQAAASAQRALEEAAKWPYFQEHAGEISAAMNKDHRLSLEGAYNRIVTPKLRQLERQAVLKEIQDKSQASTVNPSRQASPHQTPPSKQSWTDLFKREFAKRGA